MSDEYDLTQPEEWARLAADKGMEMSPLPSLYGDQLVRDTTTQQLWSEIINRPCTEVLEAVSRCHLETLLALKDLFRQ